jgi:hypothetical protein
MQIKMLKTAETANADGVLQVFGPAGRVYDLDDATATQLIENAAAEPTSESPKRKLKRSE